jgi:hypothetical protein
MPRKTAHRRNKRGGNINLPYSPQSLMGGRRRRNKAMRGGNGVAPYSSASSYSSYVNGDQNAQYSRVFSQAGPYGNIPGNISIGAQGQNANMAGSPSAGSLALIQKAGSRHRRGKHTTKKRRGGFLGQVINQAIVPFGLLGMQQSYRRNKSQSSSSKSRRRYK